MLRSLGPLGGSPFASLAFLNILAPTLSRTGYCHLSLIIYTNLSLGGGCASGVF